MRSSNDEHHDVKGMASYIASLKLQASGGRQNLVSQKLGDSALVAEPVYFFAFPFPWLTLILVMFDGYRKQAAHCSLLTTMMESMALPPQLAHSQQCLDSHELIFKLSSVHFQLGELISLSGICFITCEFEICLSITHGLESTQRRREICAWSSHTHNHTQIYHTYYTQTQHKQPLLTIYHMYIKYIYTRSHHTCHMHRIYHKLHTNHILHTPHTLPSHRDQTYNMPYYITHNLHLIIHTTYPHT